MMTKLELDIIEELEIISAKAHDLSYAQLKKHIYSLLPNFLINTQTTDKIRRPKEDGYYRDPSIIFRARSDLINRKGHAIQDPFLQLKDISIVPPESYHTIPTGRCNLAESPIFYGSNYPVTACLEAASNGFTHKTGSVTATMGAWKICQPLNLAELSFSVKTLQHLETIGKVSYQNIEKYRTGMYQHIRNQLELDSRRPYSPDFQIAALDFFPIISEKQKSILNPITICQISIVMRYLTTLLQMKQDHCMMA